MTLGNIDVTSALERAKVALTNKKIPAETRAVMDLLLVIIGMFMELHKKNSRNSSMPPSKDTFRKKKPRNSGGRKPGGQPGRPARFLKQVADPDEIQVLSVDRGALPKGKTFLSDGVEKRQVVELRISSHVLEYQAEKLIADDGQRIVASFPPGVTHPVQYGSSVKAQSVYLSQAQYLPYERLAGCFAQQFGIALSQGSIENFNRQAFQHLEKFEQGLIEKLKDETVVGADETGINIGGANKWLHAVGSSRYAFFRAHPKRGGEAMQDIGILPNFGGVVCHDHWKAYFRYDLKHALCNAHHLRELIGATEFEGVQWPKKMHHLLLKMRKLAEDGGGSVSGNVARALIRSYRKILSEGEKEYGPPKKRKKGQRGRVAQPKSLNLLARLRTYETETLRFLVESEVPFTNNASERDLRMTKVHQKISGCFRTLAGAQIFCRIRGYLLTCQKHGVSATNALQALFSGTVPDEVAYIMPRD